MDQIPQDVLKGVNRVLRKQTNNKTTIQHFSFCGGGCINSGGKLTTSSGNYFLKWNDALKFPNMFEAEAKGLQLLQSANAIAVPTVIGTSEEKSFQFVLLEFIEGSRPSKSYWAHLGHQLATMHRITSKTAGLDHNNYIGSLPQINTQEKSWIDFFITHRLEAQLRILTKADTSLFGAFNSLFTKLPSLIAEEPHSLLHGDLWSGNLLKNAKGEPCLIDPAVYFGNREVELSYTLLFGGFDNEFYASYKETYPLQKGFQERVPIYNLYPLLVHANLFSSSYLNQIKSILKKFS